MFVFYFLVWVIFNGQLTVEIAVFGVFIAAAVYAFTCRFMGWSPAKDLLLLKKSVLLAQYVILLVREVFLANMALLPLMLAPEKEPEPVLVSFRTRLRSDTARVMLANAITLTPGTITVKLKSGYLQVHCLDRSLSEGLSDSSFERLLLKIEEKR